MSSIDFGDADRSICAVCKPASQKSVSRFVAIDPAVEDPAALIAGAKPDTRVVVLDPHRDGIEHITEILEEYSSLESIHIVSHGQPGRVDLGTGQLTARTFPRYVESWQQWSNALVPGGEIWFYGCRVAAGEVGANWVRQLREMTQRAIVASSQFVGSAARGGSWQFAGDRGDLAFEEGAIAAYGGLLDTRSANILYGTDGTNIYAVNVDDATSARLGTLSFTTLSIAREAETGLVYYVETLPAGVGNQVNAQVATWNPETGANTILGTLGGDDPDEAIAQLRGVFVKMAQAAPTTRNPAYRNQLFALASSTDLFIIDRNTGKARSLGQITTRDGEAFEFRGGRGDAAFDPNNPDSLYISQGIGETMSIFRVDINTLQARFVGDTGLQSTSGGAIAFGENGQLYLNINNNLYSLSTRNAEPAFIGNLGTTFADFATLPVPTPQVNLQITNTDNLETVDIGETVTYTITVTNPGTLPPNAPRELRVCDLEGIAIENLIPAGIRVREFQSAIDGTGEVVTANVSNNVLNAQVNLNAGSNVTFTVTGVVTGSLARTLTSTATARPPEGILLRGNPPDNSVSAVDTTEAIVPDNTPPTAFDDRLRVDRGVEVTLPTLQASDSDGSIVEYTLTELPPASQGILLLDGEPVEEGQTISPDRADDLVFQAGNAFVEARIRFTATDNRGGTSNTATVTLTFENLPPETTDAELPIRSGETQALSDLGGSDPDGTISGYRIETLPPEEQGLLLLGDTPVEVGRSLTPDELADLEFAASDDFSGATFEYAAIDDVGAIDPTPATVTLTVEIVPPPAPGEGVKPPPPPPEPEPPGRGTIIDEIPHVGCPPLPEWFEFAVEVPPPIDLATLELPETDEPIVGNPEQGDVLQGFDGNDILMGGGFGAVPSEIQSDPDWLAGNGGRDWIAGNLGNDTIYSGKDDDTVLGGKDDDEIYGDRGSDVLLGDLGNDFIVGDSREIDDAEFSGSDRLEGGLGNDTLSGNEKEDTLIGGSGHDLMQGGKDGDLLFGDEGNDTAMGDWGDDTILGSRGSPVAVGASGDLDVLFGNRGADVVKGGEGEDRIYAGQDNDLVYGGKDDDWVFGDLGSDTLSGDGGDDTVIGGNGNPEDPDVTGEDLMFGGAGNDLLKGNAGNDSIAGGEGDDTIRGGRGDDRARGGAGNDEIFADLGNDWMCGGDGNDTLVGSNGVPGSGEDGSDTLGGGEGDDLILGNDGDDLLGGGDGNDSLFGGRGSDVAIGEAGDDLLCGDLASDWLDGGEGNDTLVGSNGSSDTPEDGNDTLVGGNGDDFAFGNEGDDVLGMGNGNDAVFGGQGNDAIAGEAGNDWLSGDLGDDLLSGGSGADVFILGENAGTDTIVDFEVGVDFLGLTGGLTLDLLTLTQEGNTAVIALGETQIARLTNVSLQQLGADRFLAL